MYLINKIYFRNKLELTGLNNSQAGTDEKLTDYINIYVVDFLQKLFGSEDFEELNTNIEEGVLKESAPQRWLDFVNGKTYDINGKNYVWKGLLYKNGSVDLSILTNVVFCQIFADLETNNGRISIDVKSAVKTIPRSHFIGVWNEIAEQFNICDGLAQPKVSYIHGVPFFDYFGSDKNNNYVTLSQYLTDFKDVYTNVNLNLGYEVQNRFDL